MPAVMSQLHKLNLKKLPQSSSVWCTTHRHNRPFIVQWGISSWCLITLRSLSLHPFLPLCPQYYILKCSLECVSCDHRPANVLHRRRTIKHGFLLLSIVRKPIPRYYHITQAASQRRRTITRPIQPTGMHSVMSSMLCGCVGQQHSSSHDGEMPVTWMTRGVKYDELSKHIHSIPRHTLMNVYRQAIYAREMEDMK